MENFDKQQAFTDNTEIRNYLLETSKWAKFLAISVCVFICLIITVMLFFLSALSFMNGESPPSRFYGFAWIYVVVIIAMYYFPITFLYRFSTKINQGLASNDITEITTGFRNLKSFFKFIGIFLVVGFTIYGVAALATMLVLYFKA